jgi:hypothetical protein
MKSSGRTTACSAKKRCMVTLVTSGPPWTMCSIIGPTPGIALGMSRPTLVAK